MRLVLKAAPPLRVDARALQPAAVAAMGADALARLTLPMGREGVAVGDLFTVQPDEGPALLLEGDLARFDHLGLGLAEGTLQIEGPVGDGLGLGMAGGRLVLHGHAGDLAGCSLRGGWLEVHGNVGDFAASALPGSADGMRGGSFVIHGNAGARLGDRMRRGTLVLHGDAGDFVASRMVAGTIALGGRCGAHPAYGMRRGSLLFAGPAPALPSTFVPLAGDASVFWQLLARDLARFGGAFAGLAARRVQRHAGDLAVAGKGELLLPA